MAEPASPAPPENGNGAQKNRLDRGATRGGRVQANTWGAAALIGLGLLVGLWFLVGGEEEERDTHTRRAAVNPDEAPTVPAQLPPSEPGPPPLTGREQPELPTPPDIDPFAEERMRMLLARVRRLQQEQDQRRRSKVLAFSSTAGLKAAAVTAGLPPDASARTPAADTSIRLGDVGPVEDTHAVAARVLRTTGYTITEGTVIAGVLETAINSTLPGMVRALNAADVYSHDGSQLLVPKGSRLVGRYQSDIRRGQVRIFVIWTRIIRADGVSVLINSPGTDPLGRAGLDGDVDTHFFQIFGAAILLSIIDGGIDIGIEMARRQGSGDNTVIQNRPRGMNRAGELALQDALRIQPTIHIDQGTRISILVARDLDFEAVERARGQ